MARRRRSSQEVAAAKAAEAFLRLAPRMQLLLIGLIVAAGLLFLLVHGWNQRKQTIPPPPPAPVVVQPAPTAPPPPSAAVEGLSIGPVNMLLGNPSDAAPDPADWSNYLMVKPYFSLAYNNATGTPNWVSWRVTEADVEGSAPRKQLFDPDLSLPPGFHRITHRDYTGGGFDRGHLCPHSDRDATRESSGSTFVMTNIIPQAPNVNQGAWADFEDYCRTLVRRDHVRLYITAGPVGKGGTGANGFTETLALGHVTVPAACWKVVVIVPPIGNPADDLSHITAQTRVIALLMPNDNTTVSHDWPRYRVTPREVEHRTGFHFFDQLPPDVATALKEKLDTTRISGTSGRREGNTHP